MVPFVKQCPLHCNLCSVNCSFSKYKRKLSKSTSCWYSKGDSSANCSVCKPSKICFCNSIVGKHLYCIHLHSYLNFVFSGYICYSSCPSMFHTYLYSNLKPREGLHITDCVRSYKFSFVIRQFLSDPGVPGPIYGSSSL